MSTGGDTTALFGMGVGMARHTSPKLVVATDEPQSASRLAQIREKELEFDGLVMVARSEADKRIHAATSEAEAAIEQAEAEADRLVREKEIEVMAAAEAEAAALRESASEEVDHLNGLAEARRRATVGEIVRAALGG